MFGEGLVAPGACGLGLRSLRGKAVSNDTLHQVTHDEG